MTNLYFWKNMLPYQIPLPMVADLSSPLEPADGPELTRTRLPPRTKLPKIPQWTHWNCQSEKIYCSANFCLKPMSQTGGTCRIRGEPPCGRKPPDWRCLAHRSSESPSPNPPAARCGTCRKNGFCKSVTASNEYRKPDYVWDFREKSPKQGGFE